MLDLRTTALLAIAAFTAGAGSGWLATATYKDARHGAAVATQRAEAARVMQEATEAMAKAQRLNFELANTLETTHAQSREKLDQALADNRRLARDLGGLRDPGHRPGGGCTVPATPDTTGQPDTATASGRLSNEASEFLLEFARQADRAAEYAQLCHAWITQLKP